MITSRSAKWSVLTTTYPHPFQGRPYQVVTPGCIPFARRLSIVDPFQHPALAGHVECPLDEVHDVLTSRWE